MLLRGISEEADIHRFLHGTLADLPNPFLLNGVAEGVERMIQAIGKKEKILFFGDYDVDGITGTAQLQSYFREIGVPTQAFLPHRMTEGYGLTEASVKKIVAMKPDLLVTIDNGTNAHESIAFLRKQKIDIIVIDHHETPKQRPDVVALINPKDENPRFLEKNIASAGLVFLFLMALRSRCREAGAVALPNLKRYLDLACMGTIADIVPLTGTNRLLVKFGLEELTKTSRPGLQALKEVSAIKGEVNAGSVGFRLAPRINAAGRLSDPRWALDLLLAQDSMEAQGLATKLESFNRERQQIEEKVTREAIEMVEREQSDRKGIVVASAGWPIGVVGIVASKLTERFGRPAVVLSLSEDGSEAKGSARTIPGLSVHAALKKIEGEMTRFGGHDAAAGMSLRGDNLKNFSEKFDQSVQEIWGEAKGGQLLIDTAISLKEIKTPLIKELALLEPHGAGNPAPLFMTDAVRLEGGRVVGKGHLKALLCQEGAKIEAIGFNHAPYLETVKTTPHHQVAFSPELNEWNGSVTVQLNIKALLPDNASH